MLHCCKLILYVFHIYFKILGLRLCLDSLLLRQDSLTRISKDDNLLPNLFTNVNVPYQKSVSTYIHQDVI